ncbi:MAG: hypothetical protein NTV89_19410 [Proteobacteria bacterium]|nr:hypothetical protein [Pseudomonadota bacterium]
MEKVDALFQEYNNLWHEKLMHKESIRKFNNYISYLISMGSLALTFQGVSSADFFREVLSNANNPALLKKINDIIILAFLPFTPVVLIVMSFAMNDLFQIYVIGTQIGCIERKINVLLETSLLSWEHLVCPVVYGGKLIKDKQQHEHALVNIIRKNNNFIFVPFVGLVCLFTSTIAAAFLLSKNHPYLFALYVIILFWLIGTLIYTGTKLNQYTKGESQLSSFFSKDKQFDNNPKVFRSEN